MMWKLLLRPQRLLLLQWPLLWSRQAELPGGRRWPLAAPAACLPEGHAAGTH